MAQRKARAKSARERRVVYENLPDKYLGKEEEFIIGHYLESLHNTGEKKPRPKSSHTGKGKSSSGLKRFNSNPSLSEEKSKYHMYGGGVAKKSARDMGPYAWTPLVTRTAVGFGINPFAKHVKSLNTQSRPESAPASRIRRSGSLHSLGSESSASLTASLVTSHSSSRKQKSKKGYMEKSVTLCVRAFANGSREHSVRVTAKTLLQLLEEATEKLGLPSAGRRIFLPDGTVVTSPYQLYKDCSVYISMGEPFKDPHLALRESEKIRLSSSWTISGIMLPEEKNSSKKVSLSKRMKDLVEAQKYRILVFRNGECREGVEIVSNRFDEFLGDCTMKLGLNSSARALYDWQGKEIQCFSQVPVFDENIQTSQKILGPVWVTKGERFSPSGAYDFLMALCLDLKQKIEFDKKRLQVYEAKQNGKEVDDPEILSRTDAEIERDIAEVQSNIVTQEDMFKTLKSRLKITKKMRKDEDTLGSSYKFQHISEVNEGSRLVGTKGYRLKFRMNGVKNCDAILVYFSNKDLRTGRKTQEEMLHCFFNILNSNQSLKESFIGQGRRSEFKRAFLVNGTEVTDINEVDSDAEVWLSLGEDFVPIEYDVIGLATDKVKVLSLWDERLLLQRDAWLGADEKLAKPSLWTATTTLPMDSLETQTIADTNPEDKRIALIQEVNDTRLRLDDVFLQNKKDQKLALYPEIHIVRKGRGEDTDFWGDDANHWIFTQNGTIMNKRFRNLVLCVKDQEIKLVNGEVKIEGFAVGLTVKKNVISLDEKTADGSSRPPVPADSSQIWKLTANGQIISVKFPELFLTSVNDLSVEVPSPLPVEENNAKEKQDSVKQKSSSSASGDSDSENTSITPDGATERTKQKKKRKKKKKEKKKEQKKWWNFGSSSSSSSSDSSDDENEARKERTKSIDDIKVRMKLTSSDDERVNSEKEKTEQENENDVTLQEAEKEEEEERIKSASELLKELPEVYGGVNVRLGIFSKFDDKDPMKIRQRWAIKTEDASATLSDKWVRQGLAWPVNEADTWVEDAVAGYLLPCAPKLKRKAPSKEKAMSPFYGQPARLKVLRNGEPDISRAVIVVGPDVSNMTRKISASLPLKWKKSKGTFQAVQTASASEVEFEHFLDRCTDALNLSFAARRLFDVKGKELTSVDGLERDQIVYVSSGEMWIDPNLTHAEQQRRSLLANLASDVNKIRNYVALSDQADFILQVSGQLQAGARLIVSKKPFETDQVTTEESSSTLSLDESKQENDIMDLQSSFLTSHQIAHMKSEERLQNIRERLQMGDSGVLSDQSTGNVTSEDFPFSNPSLARKFSRSSEPIFKMSPNVLRQWVYQDGFIHLKANKKLVLGVQQSDESTSGQEVVLCNKKLEDAMQRWVISEIGFFQLKCNPSLVLSVATPSLQTDPFSESQAPCGYEGCCLILGRRIDYYNGNAHQMFGLDEETGFINVFSTDLTNKEITSAIKAYACTYSVLGPKNIQQPGYTVLDGIKPDVGAVRVCESCGKAVRGKLKLQRTSEYTEFTCAMGSPEDYGLTTAGSFKCLTSKVDLSQREAESTLLAWEKQLKRLQQESSVRVIAYELNLAQSTPSVRVCARKNGDAGVTDGVIVIANSINQFLDLCTYKLGLTQAARKMYTMEGELITDMSQLLQPYYPEMCLPVDKSFIGKKNSQSQNEEQGVKEEPFSSATKPSSDVSSVISDTTFTIPSRNGTPSGYSLNSEKHVSFVDQDRDEQETVIKEEVNTGVPRMERMDVRIPVDVWVSCGEPFIHFADSEKRAMRTLQDREERALVADYLEQEKHLLRQIQGRRYGGRSSAQGNVKLVHNKVLDLPTKQEEVLEKSIEELQVHLSELKTQQERDQLDEASKKRPRSSRIYEKMNERKLYDLPRGVTVHVFPNGENVDRAVAVVATNLNEFLDRATSRLDLNSAARKAYTVDGIEITDWQNVEKNQLICVTSGEKFVPTTERRRRVEMRASWSRAQRGGDASPAPNFSRKSETVLALPAPVSPTSKKAPKFGNRKHEETLHVFENDRDHPYQNSSSRPTRPMSSRPTSRNPSTFSPTNSPVRQTNEQTAPSRPMSASPSRHISTRPKSAASSSHISAHPTSAHAKSLNLSRASKSATVRS